MLFNWFTKSTLQVKVLSLVAVSTAVVLAGAGIRMRLQAKEALTTTNDIYAISQKTTVVGQLELVELKQVDAFLQHVLLGPKLEERDKLLAKIGDFQKNFLEVLNSSTMSFDDDNLEASVIMMKKHQDFVKALNKAIDDFFVKKSLTNEQASTVLVPYETAAAKALHELQDNMLDVILKKVKQSENSIQTSLHVSLVAAVGIGIGALLMIGLILRSVNGQFVHIVSELADASSRIFETSQSMLENSDHLSKAVNQQASSVQQTVASMTEMSGMLSQSSNNAIACKNLSKEVAEKAKVGKEIMQDMGNSMSSIESANAQLQNMVAIIREISTKTNVINDIVFKTQLLSFNASIEAASAGQHGRGFAVIAGEVGSLAQLSGDAAKEIAVLLENSQKDVSQILSATGERVTEGRGVLNRAIKTFNEIAGDIETISTQAQVISDATREQEEGIKQTSQAMLMIDEATHQSATVASGAQQASLTLGDQSNRIVEISASIRTLIIGKNSSKKASHSQKRDKEISSDPEELSSELESELDLDSTPEEA